MQDTDNTVHLSFPQIEQDFSEFSIFRETDESLKHELDSV